MEKEKSLHRQTKKHDGTRDRISVLYEDSWIVIIEKPSGMLSVPYSGSRTRTAQSVLEQLMRKAGTYTARHRPFVAHRLDRDTSGVMMFALTEAAQKKIMGDWQSMVTERLYRAVAENPRRENLRRDNRENRNNHANRENSRGDWQLADSGVIDAPLAYNAYNLAFVPRAGEKFKTVSARTNYKVLEKGEAYTMFELSLDTGRKNQIRAHLASCGYPIAGDENYRAMTNPFGRLALHACTLAFVHPFTGEEMRFETPEPSGWFEFVRRKNIRTAGREYGKKL